LNSLFCNNATDPYLIAYMVNNLSIIDHMLIDCCRISWYLCFGDLIL